MMEEGELVINGSKSEGSSKTKKKNRWGTKHHEQRQQQHRPPQEQRNEQLSRKRPFQHLSSADERDWHHQQRNSHYSHAMPPPCQHPYDHTSHSRGREQRQFHEHRQQNHHQDQRYRCYSDNERHRSYGAYASREPPPPLLPPPPDLRFYNDHNGPLENHHDNSRSRSTQHSRNHQSHNNQRKLSSRERSKSSGSKKREECRKKRRKSSNATEKRSARSESSKAKEKPEKIKAIKENSDEANRENCDLAEKDDKENPNASSQRSDEENSDASLLSGKKKSGQYQEQDYKQGEKNKTSPQSEKQHQVKTEIVVNANTTSAKKTRQVLLSPLAEDFSIIKSDENQSKQKDSENNMASKRTITEKKYPQENLASVKEEKNERKLSKKEKETENVFTRNEMKSLKKKEKIAVPSKKRITTEKEDSQENLASVKKGKKKPKSIKNEKETGNVFTHNEEKSIKEKKNTVVPQKTPLSLLNRAKGITAEDLINAKGISSSSSLNNTKETTAEDKSSLNNGKGITNKTKDTISGWLSQTRRKSVIVKKKSEKRPSNSIDDVRIRKKQKVITAAEVVKIPVRKSVKEKIKVVKKSVSSSSLCNFEDPIARKGKKIKKTVIMEDHRKNCIKNIENETTTTQKKSGNKKVKAEQKEVLRETGKSLSSNQKKLLIKEEKKSAEITDNHQVISEERKVVEINKKVNALSSELEGERTKWRITSKTLKKSGNKKVKPEQKEVIKEMGNLLSLNRKNLIIKEKKKSELTENHQIFSEERKATAETNKKVYTSSSELEGGKTKGRMTSKKGGGNEKPPQVLCKKNYEERKARKRKKGIALKIAMRQVSSRSRSPVVKTVLNNTSTATKRDLDTTKKQLHLNIGNSPCEKSLVVQRKEKDPSTAVLSAVVFSENPKDEGIKKVKRCNKEELLSMRRKILHKITSNSINISTTTKHDRDESKKQLQSNEGNSLCEKNLVVHQNEADPLTAVEPAAPSENLKDEGIMKVTRCSKGELLLMRRKTLHKITSRHKLSKESRISKVATDTRLSFKPLSSDQCRNVALSQKKIETPSSKILTQIPNDESTSRPGKGRDSKNSRKITHFSKGTKQPRERPKLLKTNPESKKLKRKPPSEKVIVPKKKTKPRSSKTQFMDTSYPKEKYKAKHTRRPSGIPEFIVVKDTRPSPCIVSDDTTGTLESTEASFDIDPLGLSLPSTSQLLKKSLETAGKHAHNFIEESDNDCYAKIPSKSNNDYINKKSFKSDNHLKCDSSGASKTDNEEVNLFAEKMFGVTPPVLHQKREKKKSREEEGDVYDSSDEVNLFAEKMFGVTPPALQLKREQKGRKAQSEKQKKLLHEQKNMYDFSGKVNSYAEKKFDVIDRDQEVVYDSSDEVNLFAEKMFGVTPPALQLKREQITRKRQEEQLGVHQEQEVVYNSDDDEINLMAEQMFGVTPPALQRKREQKQMMMQKQQRKDQQSKRKMQKANRKSQQKQRKLKDSSNEVNLRTDKMSGIPVPDPKRKQEQKQMKSQEKQRKKQQKNIVVDDSNDEQMMTQKQQRKDQQSKRKMQKANRMLQQKQRKLKDSSNEVNLLTDKISGVPPPDRRQKQEQKRMKSQVKQRKKQQKHREVDDSDDEMNLSAEKMISVTQPALKQKRQQKQKEKKVQQQQKELHDSGNEINLIARKKFDISPSAIQRKRQQEKAQYSSEEDTSTDDEDSTLDEDSIEDNLTDEDESYHSETDSFETDCDSVESEDYANGTETQFQVVTSSAKVKKEKKSAEIETEEERKRKKAEAKPLTAKQLRNILSKDPSGKPSSDWVRRSCRQPCKAALKAPSVRLLLRRLRTNDKEVVILKMKRYINDPATPQVVIDRALDALEENTNCEALYIQNFNVGMREEQILRLLKILQLPTCKIWCLNIGETYNVKFKTWKKFARGLKRTKITHMYASEHTIDTTLKDKIRGIIRNNRKKHDMHKNPDNLDTIIQCTHCWWNPMNAKSLQPYIKKKGYEHMLLDREGQGLQGTTSGATVGDEKR